MKPIKIEKNVEPILNVTKNVIKINSNYNDYYLHENNSLYQNQLPLLMKSSRIREAALIKKFLGSPEKMNEEKKLNFTNFPLSSIRHAHIRSKKLPPLCPFYNNKGELLPNVVATSRAFSRNGFITETINQEHSVNKKQKLLGTIYGSCSPINKKKEKIEKNFSSGNDINSEDLNNDLFFDEKYDGLKYDESAIFNKKEECENYIDDLFNQISENDDINLEDAKKQKMLEFGKSKKKIYLTFKSLNIKIKDINNKNNENIFEYILPINLLPLFYFKGPEKFKIILLELINFNFENKKFEILTKENGLLEKIRKILNNCKDFQVMKKDNELSVEIDDEAVNIGELKKNISSLQRNAPMSNFSCTVKNPKIDKKFNPLLIKAMINKNENKKNPLFVATNIDIPKKQYKLTHHDLYPKEKKSNEFNHYDRFEFYWILADKIFLVTFDLPLISFKIPSNDISVVKYLDYELIFYLMKKDFQFWEYYGIKYLASFKKFRILLTQLNSVDEKTHTSFYLSNPKTKSFTFTDCKIINIITKDNNKKLELNTEQEKNNNNQTNNEKTLNKEDKEKKKEDFPTQIDQTTQENKENTDKKEEENKENTDKKEEVKKEDEKKDEEKKEDEKKDEEKKEEEKKDEVKKEDEKKEENENENNDDSENVITSVPSNIENTILEQKCFIAIATFYDSESLIANEYVIHFNYSHFNKFKQMEKYMPKISFLMKFIDISYENKTIHFDYETLNNFNEKKWMSDVGKYNMNYVNLPKINSNNENVNKLKTEFPGDVKGTSISIEIKPPIILKRKINEGGDIETRKLRLTNDDEKKISEVRIGDSVNLCKNIYEIAENLDGGNQMILGGESVDITETKKKLRRKSLELNQKTQVISGNIA